MSNVTDINDQKPHLMIPGSVNVHVMPKSLIEDVINGKKDITDIEEYEDFLPTILKEWLTMEIK